MHVVSVVVLALFHGHRTSRKKDLNRGILHRSLFTAVYLHTAHGTPFHSLFSVSHTTRCGRRGVRLSGPRAHPAGCPSAYRTSSLGSPLRPPHAHVLDRLICLPARLPCRLSFCGDRLVDGHGWRRAERGDVHGADLGLRERRGHGGGQEAVQRLGGVCVCVGFLPSRCCPRGARTLEPFRGGVHRIPTAFGTDVSRVKVSQCYIAPPALDVSLRTRHPLPHEASRDE